MLDDLKQAKDVNEFVYKVYYIFLSLVIFLLSFFILLNSISQHDSTKSDRVLSSVSKKFSNYQSKLGDTTPILTSDTKTNNEFLTDDFVSNLEGIFGKNFEAKTQTNSNFSYLNIVIPENMFFGDDNQLLDKSEKTILQLTNLVKGSYGDTLVGLQISYNVIYNNENTIALQSRNRNLLYAISISDLPKDLLQTSIVVSNKEFVNFRFIVKLNKA